MKAEEHQDFGEEEQHLKHTLTIIDQELRKTQENRESGPAYRNAYLESERITSQHASNMQQALAEPYFARVDFIRADAESARALYIGKFGVKPSDQPYIVLDWKAPIAQLYYKQQWQKASYRAPNGDIHGSVVLRRNYKIRSGSLHEIVDESPPSTLVGMTLQDSNSTNETEVPVSTFLHDVLAESRTTKLRDVVATIQPEQYSLIEAPLSGVLVIQGVAGSGKTSLALHRVAYLLYHHEKTIAANRMLIVGPSTLFLQSISDVLPGLGVQGIRQTTFTNWAQGWLGNAIKVESRSTQIEHLIDHSIEQHIGSAEHRLIGIATSFLYRFKGSMRMASLLHAHIVATKNALPSRARTVRVDYAMPKEQGMRVLNYIHTDTVTLTVSAEDVGNIVGQILAASGSNILRLNLLRDRCVEAVIEYLWQRFRDQPLYGRPHQFRDENERQTWETLDIERASAFRAAIKDSVQKVFNEWWPTVTPVNCYRSLIANRSRLIQAALGMEEARTSETPIHEWELELLFMPEAQKHDYQWLEEDLAPLCYADLLLNGSRLESYDHILVDEVQDLSPLELHLLYLHAEHGSMTLLGDIAQGLGWTGIRTLEDLDGSVKVTSITHAVIDTSYRSTYEITMFANRILGQLSSPGSNIIVARPVSRHGPQPNLVGCPSHREMLMKAIDLVTEAKDQGSRSIAVICRTSAATYKVAKAFRSHGIPCESVESHHDRFAEGIVLVPAYLAKGLEFDTVLVVDVDEKTYTHNDYDIKLLYIAVTRALHHLHVLWVGNVSPLLASSCI